MNAAKQVEISRQILEKVAAGMSVRDALDAVCGQGSADRLIDTLQFIFTEPPKNKIHSVGISWRATDTEPQSRNCFCSEAS